MLEDNHDAGKLNKNGVPVSMVLMTNMQASKAVKPTKETLFLICVDPKYPFEGE